MIVIMGATGRVGAAALENVRQAGMPVRGISRQARDARCGGVEWACVDALDTQALAQTFQGATAVFVLNPV